MSGSGPGTATGGSGLRRPGAMRGKLKAPKRIGLDQQPEEMWKRLAHAIEQIQHHNVSTLSYEEHYRYAYNLVLYHQGAMLYEGVKRKVEDHLNQQCRDLLVPAFPPGAAATPSSDIILPEQLSISTSSRTTSSLSKGSSSSAKGKGRAGDVPDAAASQEQTVVDAAASASASSSVSAFGSNSVEDSTDAVVRSQSAERLLKAMKEVWDDHCACMGKLRDVLKYVDRVYVIQNSVLTVWDLGLELFRDTVIQSRKYPIATCLYTALLTQIQLERRGQVINRSAVKANVDMLISLSYPKPNAAIASRPTVYKHTFEPAFLATSRAFYQSEAQRLLEASDAKSYLRHVERRFVEEEGRVAVFLAPTTNAALREVMEKHLLAGHLKTILNMPGSGLTNMLEEDLKPDLRRLYKLFARVQLGGMQELKAGLKAFIAERGRAINESVGGTASKDGPAEDAALMASKAEQAQQKAGAAAASSPQATLALKWVEDVLAFKVKFDQILHVSFDGDKGIETVLNEAFESFINTNPRAPEFISLFIDENLKKGLKGKTEEEVEDILNRTIVVFRFLHEKDIFERYYKNHLARRLLASRSVSDDAERGMMAKLKVECGHGYVQKLQGMLNDMKVSEDTASAFGDYLKKAARPMPLDLSVSVLTSTYWPLSAQVQPCTMPPSMMSARQAFETFYQSRHSGRLLTWHPNLGSADVRVAFKSRKHELNVSTYALVVLLLFDQELPAPLSYTAIRDSTAISDADLKRTLQSLACAKYKILLKEPKGRDVNEGDRFVFNENFTCPLARIKIAMVAARVETAAERKETNEKVEEERKNQVEACVVRVMKDRKVMSHNELINEVIRQLAGRFSPSPALVKKRIESLIDREYLERHPDQRNMYSYVA